MKNTKILLFVLKIIPFLRGDEKYEVFEKIEELFSNKENKYRKMMLYYKKNWLDSKYVNYYELSKEEHLNRTNNYFGSFHGHMNDILQCYHPKISYLISKYKNYMVNIYEKIKSNLLKNNNSNIVEKFSIINDILKFIKN